MKVILLGVYPPPIGGVSIHIQRFADYLLENGHAVEVLDYPGAGEEAKPAHVIRLPAGMLRKLWFIRQYAQQQPADAVVHFHVAAMGRFRWVAPLLFRFFYRQPKFITIHSGLIVGARMPRWSKAYLRFLLGRCAHVIPVSQELAAFVSDLGVPAGRMSVMPAYITKAPTADLLPPRIAELRSKHALVMTSGFLMAPYNFDVLIDALPQLDAERYHFLFVFYGQTDPVYEDQILRRLADFENVTVLRNQSSDVFLSLLSACDVYVRTTVVDGDAITIREALDFGTAVFATDCVWRPEGCHLFKHDDAASLVELFAKPTPRAGDGQRPATAPNAQRLLALYRRVGRDTAVHRGSTVLN